MAKNGRPFKLSPEQLAQLEKLAAINCSYGEMAAVLEIDASSLTRSYAQVIQRGRERGRMSLKRKQYELAMSGNVSMLIWLGKNLLDQSDKREEKLDARISNEGAEMVDLFKQVLKAKADK